MAGGHCPEDPVEEEKADASQLRNQARTDYRF